MTLRSPPISLRLSPPPSTTRGNFTASAGVARVLARSHLNVDAPVGLDGFAALLLVLFIWQGERREVRFLWATKRGAKPERNEAERVLLVARMDVFVWQYTKM